MENEMERHDFYHTTAWRKCSAEYKRMTLWCERCMSDGLYVPGVIVHHTKHLTDENYIDPSIALNFENLELLCLSCHNKEHFKQGRRYEVAEDGTVTVESR